MSVMKNFRTACLVVLAIVVATACGQQTHAGTSRARIEESFREGKTIVLVIAPAKTRQADDSEAYGDWANYLNDFAASKPGDTRIIKLTPASFSRLLMQPKLAHRYAVLFVKDRSHALVYDGMVVEPGIYTAGKRYLAGKRDEVSESAFGLHESMIHLK